MSCRNWRASFCRIRNGESGGVSALFLCFVCGGRIENFCDKRGQSQACMNQRSLSLGDKTMSSEAKITTEGSNGELRGGYCCIVCLSYGYPMMKVCLSYDEGMVGGCGGWMILCLGLFCGLIFFL